MGGSLFDLVLGLVVILVPVGLLLTTLIMIVRLSGRGELRRGLGYVFLLPRRRKSLSYLLAATATLFLLAGVVNGLTLLDMISETVSDYAIVAADIGASLLLFLVLAYGLRPTAISATEQAALAREPLGLSALGLIRSMEDPEN